MADSSSLKVMCLFEAGSRLERCSSEVICLAAHLYHRFFKVNPDRSGFDLFTFGAACIKLAHAFYEKPINNNDLVLIMASVAHGTCSTLDPSAKSKLEQSIDLAARIVSVNLEYQIDYKGTKMMTPGELIRRRGPVSMETDDIVAIEKDDPSSSQSSDDGDGEDEDEADRLLTRNSRLLISPHRYLVHYLKHVKLLVDPQSMETFEKISNLAWIFLNDFYWSPCVTQHSANHLACACFMMAIQTFRKELENNKNPHKVILWNLLDKKWNLIFCDDLEKTKLDHIIATIVQQYKEYERIFQHEFSTYVIDPTK